MPFVDGGIELQTGVSTFPGTEQDFFPQVARFDTSDTFAGCALTERPEIVVFNCLHELVGHPDSIIGVLASNSMICFRLVIRVVFIKIKRCVTLFNKG